MNNIHKLFYFEKEHDGCFRHPNNYDRGALAMLTNHDVPTLASWWSATDLELRYELDLFKEGVELSDVLGQRKEEKHKLLDWLAGLGLFHVENRDEIIGTPLSLDLASSILVGGASCASQLFVIQLEDLELMDAPVNVPGTSTEYSNWQRKLTKSLEDLFADEGVRMTLQKIAEKRLN